MKIMRPLVPLILCTACTTSPAADMSLEQQAAVFFEHYIGLYNQRIGHPEQSEAFRYEMARLIHEPMLNSPFKGKPPMSVSSDGFAGNLESFVTVLEELGVTRLQYEQIQVHVLTPNKIIANNIGHGINEAGEILYETISVYFLYRADDQWQIAMLNAYDIDNALNLK